MLTDALVKLGLNLLCTHQHCTDHFLAAVRRKERRVRSSLHTVQSPKVVQSTVFVLEPPRAPSFLPRGLLLPFPALPLIASVLRSFSLSLSPSLPSSLSPLSRTLSPLFLPSLSPLLHPLLPPSAIYSRFADRFKCLEARSEISRSIPCMTRRQIQLRETLRCRVRFLEKCTTHSF